MNQELDKYLTIAISFLLLFSFVSGIYFGYNLKDYVSFRRYLKKLNKELEEQLKKKEIEKEENKIIQFPIKRKEKE